MFGVNEVENPRSKPNVGHARKLARRVIAGANIKQPPVILNNVVSYLKTEYELEIVPWEFEDSVSGTQVTHSSNACSIAYNENHHVHRQRFTVAHEIAHFLAGHTREKSMEKKLEEAAQEAEANEFAGELLMPLGFLKKDIADGLKDVKQLAARYLVSEEAMYYRLMSSKLLNKL